MSVISPSVQHKCLEMAEKGELVCEESVPPSPAVTPRQSMADSQESSRTGDQNSSTTVLSDTSDSKTTDEQAKEEEKGTVCVCVCCQHASAMIDIV